MAFLDVRNMLLEYESSRGAVRAVDSVSFRIEGSGQVLGLIGETGSGKSSLVMALARILPTNVISYTGEAFLEERNIMALTNEQFRRQIRWKEISVVFQGSMNGFNPVHRIGRQLAEPLRRTGEMQSAAIESRVAELLQLVGLSGDTRRRYPHELSGGMKQRVAIAMALCLDPTLVVLDEPTSALDVSVQAQIMNLLKRLKWERDISMIFVTHDIALASEVSDTVAVMYAGQIREIGPVDDVLREPRDPYSSGLIASIPGLHSKTAPRFVSGSPPDPTALPAGCRFAPRCPHVFDRCSEDPALIVITGSDGSPTGEFHAARCWLLEQGAGRE